MPRGSWSYGETSPLTIPGYGGFTDVAHDLSRRAPYRTVTRQAVYSWWKHRFSNKSPDRHDIEQNGVVRLLFSLEEWRRWYAQRNNLPYEEDERDGRRGELPRDEVGDGSL